MSTSKAAVRSEGAALSPPADAQSGPVRVVDARLPASTAMEQWYNDIYVPNRDPMLDMAARYEVSEDVAADFYQDVMLSFWERRDRLAPGEFTVGAIANAMRFKFKRYCKRRKRRVTLTDEIAHTAPVPLIVPLGEDPVTRWANGVRQIVSTFGPRMKQAYLLVQEDGLTRAEAAEIMGVHEGTVDQHIYRGNAIVRAAFRRAGFDPDEIERYLRKDALPSTTEASHD